MTFDEIRIGEILMRCVEEAAAADARRRAAGPHPVALALRDIAVGLEAIGLWDDFRLPQTGHLILHATAPESGDRRRFRNVRVAGWKPGKSAEEDALTALVQDLLMALGCLHTPTFEEQDIEISVRNFDATQMSAHRRLEIAGTILDHLTTLRPALVNPRA